MDLLHYWGIFRKRWWVIAILLAIAVAYSAWNTSRQIPVYQTRTRMVLKPGASNLLIPGYQSSSAADLASAYAEYMRTQAFAERVLERVDGNLTAGEVMGAVSTRFVPSQFFDIYATHRNPVTAQILSTTVAEVFIAENLARQQAEQAQIQAQRDPVQQAERQRLHDLQNALEDELTYYADRIAGLQSQITRLEGQPPSTEGDAQLVALRRDMVEGRSQRVQALSSLAQTQAALVSADQGTARSFDTAIVIDPAPLPTVPLKTNAARDPAIALLAAIIAGGTILLLWDYLDYTVRTPDQLDALYGLPTLGVVGMILGLNVKGGPESASELISVSNSRSPVVEAYRALRVNIQFASPEGSLHSLLVTSAGPGEGKTITAANLAVVIAQAGNRVILVDADLRKPRLHRLFGLAKAPGLTNAIIDRTGDIARYLQPTAVENLRVLTCGMPPPNPAELLGFPRTVEIMTALEAEADMVIYDSPPVATVTDAVVVAPRMDAVLQVVRAGHTRRDIVLQGKKILEKVGAQLLGPVLNEVVSSDLSYYSYYYYYGSYHEASDQDGGDGKGLPRQRRRFGAAVAAKVGSLLNPTRTQQGEQSVDKLS